MQVIIRNIERGHDARRLAAQWGGGSAGGGQLQRADTVRNKAWFLTGVWPGFRISDLLNLRVGNVWTGFGEDAEDARAHQDQQHR